jgi:hypothetical protein
VEAQRLDSKKRFICRIGKQTIHTLFPLTGYAIYHESKPGPFLGENDSIVLPWAPSREDAAGRDELVHKLEAALPRRSQRLERARRGINLPQRHREHRVRKLDQAG